METHNHFSLTKDELSTHIIYGSTRIQELISLADWYIHLQRDEKRVNYHILVKNKEAITFYGNFDEFFFDFVFYSDWNLV